MDLESAKALGAMALFGEKYDDDVRVVKMGDFSTELCGGIHVKATGDIGLFKITSESGIASGVRRIEAVTGTTALTLVQEQQATLQTVASIFKTDAKNVFDKVQLQNANIKNLEKELNALKQKLASQQGSDLLSKVQKMLNVKMHNSIAVVHLMAIKFEMDLGYIATIDTQRIRPCN